jgi:hypothetical protein
MDKRIRQDYAVEMNKRIIVGTWLSGQLVIQYKFKIER